MKSLLRSKKGLDYAAMMVLIVILCLIYLFIQLQSKVNTFNVRIGEPQMALLNAYQRGENALMYVDQSARYSAFKSLDALAQRGGMAKDECGTIDEGSKKIYAWSMHGKDCTASVQPYDAFSELVNGHMTLYSAKYKDASLPSNNYQVLVQKNSITGTALAPATVDLKPPTEIREWYIGPIAVATAELKKAAIGEYAFRPSFTVSAASGLDVYDSLKAAVRVFYDCTNAYSTDDCAKTATLFSAVRSSSNPDYLICTAKNPAVNPYGAMSDIVFALYAPAVQTATV
jgi:hypothetical protein